MYQTITKENEKETPIQAIWAQIKTLDSIGAAAGAAVALLQRTCLY